MFVFRYTSFRHCSIKVLGVYPFHEQHKENGDFLSFTEDVFKYKVLEVLPSFWVQVLTPCRGETQKYSFHPAFCAPVSRHTEVSYVLRLAREKSKPGGCTVTVLLLCSCRERLLIKQPFIRSSS